MRPHSLFRPPGEKGHLILRVADGCPWNKCTFCGMYRGVKYRAVPRDEWMEDLEKELSEDPFAERVFLADGDVMAFSMAALREIIGALRRHLPMLKRVSLYANGCSILNKSSEDLAELKSLGVHTLYMGLESGSGEVLRRVVKRETSRQMIDAARRAASCGLRMSVMVLAGLGGRELSEEHARDTAAALNEMQPRLLSVLCVTPFPTTPLGEQMAAGEWQQLSEAEVVAEIRALVSGLEMRRTVFRANHVSNKVPLAGRLPTEKSALLEELDAALASGALSAVGPGRQAMWL